MAKRTFAGILIKRYEISVMLAEERERRSNEEERPLDLYPIGKLATWPLDGVTPGQVVDALKEASAHILAKSGGALTGVGSACYGPLRSVAIEDRPDDLGKTRREKRKADDDSDLMRRYGTVWDRSVHVNLRGLPVYEIVKGALGPNVDVRVHSDVSCGAITESLDRMTHPKPIVAGGTVMFIHIAEGVGGSYAAGGRPYFGTMHSEVGYTTPALYSRDYHGWELFRLAGDEPVFLENLIELEALLQRTRPPGVRPDDPLAWNMAKMASLPPDHIEWQIVAEYCAQTAWLATVMVSPRRVVFHGPPFAHRPALLGEVRKRFRGWQGKERIVLYTEMKDADTYIDTAMRDHADPMLRGAVLLAALPEEALRVQPPVWMPKALKKGGRA